MSENRRRLLLAYAYFGPYHLARWRAVRSHMAAHGWDVVPVQILARQDRYDWGVAVGDYGIVRLDLPSDGKDQIRWRDVARFLRSIAALRPDVVAVNGWAPRASILLHAWCVLRGVPRIVVTDTTVLDAPRRPFKERVKKILLYRVGAAFAAGRASRNYVATLGVDDDRITTGCDVVDNTHFTAGRTPRRWGTDRPAQLLTVARLVPEKNLIPAAEAFLDVIQEHRFDIFWTIAGYGPLESKLQSFAEESGGRIRLLGTVTYSEMPAVMANSDVLWLPSTSEPWGLVVNEAMAVGLPVAVSTSCGCAADLVTEENGWTFDPVPPEALREGLLRVLRDRPRWPEMGEVSKRVVANWDLDRFVDGLFEAAHIAIGGESVPR